MMVRHDFSTPSLPECEVLRNQRKGTAPYLPQALVFIIVGGKLAFELLL